ncbi:uncharacterized protein LOC117590614 [Drosophila guanche]|uniref:Uncharacterized protein n=1 Tax=Drosophila guanche TaxID=7266 RepID=A0A3B0K474_DROGU|nr:uncharacterized protein LOC117590614 [Drosophila guanche]SPP88955.1 Hypothetical predicted protein [Drosophila guanche]
MVPHKKRIISAIKLRGYIDAVVEQQMNKHWPPVRHSSIALRSAYMQSTRLKFRSNSSSSKNRRSSNWTCVAFYHRFYNEKIEEETTGIDFNYYNACMLSSTIKIHISQELSLKFRSCERE